MAFANAAPAAIGARKNSGHHLAGRNAGGDPNGAFPALWNTTFQRMNGNTISAGQNARSTTPKETASADLAGDQFDGFAGKRNNLSRFHFCPFSRVDRGIDFHPPFGDGGMGCAARFTKAGSLEQLVELNVVAANGKGDAHDVSDPL